MAKKITQKEAEFKIIKKCEEKNYSLLDFFKYKNCDTKIHLKCNKDNHSWFVTYNNFINHNNGCPKCAKKITPTQEEAELEIAEKCITHNYTLLKPFVYKTRESLLSLKCNKDGYVWETTYNIFIILNSGCPKCAKKIVPTQEEAKLSILERCKKLNYSLLESFVYKTALTTKIHLKCNKDNHEWYVTYDRFLNGKTGCPKCAGKCITQNEIEIKIKKKCEEYNYSLLESFVYKTALTTKIHLKCNKDGHSWFTTYNNFINHNRSCPKCNESKGEKIINDYLKSNNIVFIREYKFKECKNVFALPFDFYLPEQNICIEYDGEQHFKVNERYGGIKEFEKRILNDDIKNKFCENNNIKLIRIPYFDFKNIKETLNVYIYIIYNISLSCTF
jgi:very-short-patch-repair endonuclease